MYQHLLSIHLIIYWKREEIMKITKIIALVVFVLASFTTSFAQSPDANFVPKDPVEDNLLTSENTVLLVIDWQQDLIDVVHNIDQDIMMNNIQAMVKTARLFDIPVIETTIGVEMAGNPSTVESIKSLISEDVENIDRVSLNAWQNKTFVKAVEETGRKKAAHYWIMDFRLSDLYYIRCTAR